MLKELKITDFLDKLASKSPTPGGGSVAALSGGLSISLVSMVCNLTLGKKNYEGVEEQTREILVNSERIRGEFTKLVDLDAEAFQEIMDAYKLPKSDETEKKIRSEAIQAALRKATQVPLRTMELSVETLALAKECANIGNKNVVSDAGVAGSLAAATMESAWFNVQININSIKDQSFTEGIEERAQKLLDEGDALYDDTMEYVEKRLT